MPRAVGVTKIWVCSLLQTLIFWRPNLIFFIGKCQKEGVQLHNQPQHPILPLPTFWVLKWFAHPDLNSFNHPWWSITKAMGAILHIASTLPHSWLNGCDRLAKILDPLRNLDLTGNLALVPIIQTHATFTFMLYYRSEMHKWVATLVGCSELCSLSTLVNNKARDTLEN